MKVALLGPLQSGKSTLLSAISGKALSPSGSTHITEEVVPIPDQRLDWLTELYKPKRTVPATLDCLDLPGLCFTDDSSRAAARRLINETRTVDMYVLIARAFEDESIPPYRGKVDPKRDISELQTELLLADLELVLTRIEKLEQAVKKPTKTIERDKAELELQKKLQQALEAEKPVRTVIETEAEHELVRALGYFTMKPIMVVVNVGEASLGSYFDISSVVDESVPVVNLCAKLEKEIAELDAESRGLFMSDLGINEPASHKFIASCYAALGLISFLTVGEDEVRAWPIRKDLTALDAAGKIHTDIKKGFIRAETIAYEDLRSLGSEKAVKAAGKMRLEGKTYVVQDGDIMHFRFNI